jgi:hypothetical protein
MYEQESPIIELDLNGKKFAWQVSLNLNPITGMILDKVILIMGGGRGCLGGFNDAGHRGGAHGRGGYNNNNDGSRHPVQDPYYGYDSRQGHHNNSNNNYEGN